MSDYHKTLPIGCFLPERIQTWLALDLFLHISWSNIQQTADHLLPLTSKIRWNMCPWLMFFYLHGKSFFLIVNANVYIFYINLALE